MANNKKISIEDFINKLNYDPTSGEITWKKNGKLAGWYKDGYLRVGKFQLYGHRIAFFIMEGYWPKEVDHINGVRSDNRWENLRDVSHLDNCRNLKVAKKHNKTKTLYVHKHGLGFVVSVGGYRKYVSNFVDACKLAEKKKEEIYGYL